ncbi:sigma-E processing peptidase SpoIIGA [uncultured Ruthenibacterium sp.]|uniref:sigma-E processing peptidase SpoIIGA n=1 Tax=uncultured Ruthenibacterium sp. TaxID=1905347 RepID=UPI00349EE166
MRGVVYVDILFFTNALIGWCLLRCCASLTGYYVRPFPLLAGGILAGLSSMMMILPPLPHWEMTALKLFSALIIVAVVFFQGGLVVVIKSLLWYIAMNVLLSGVVLLVLYYLEPSGIQMYNMTLYFNISPLLLIGCIAGTYIFIQSLLFFFGKPKEQIVLPFQTIIDQKEIVGKALWDTGYHIRDPITGAYTFLLSFPQTKGQMTDALEQALSEYFNMGTLKEGLGLRLVPTRTATGVKLLPAIKAPLRLWVREKWREMETSVAVFTLEPLGNGSFDALVNPASANL